jgi:hypothetical protein
MTKLQKITILLILFIFSSCQKNEDDYILNDDRFEKFQKLKINEAIKTEFEISSKERTFNNTFGIGTSYYPNTNNFILTNPKVYEKEQKNFNLETNYFFTPNDSLVKVIFYEWSPKNDALIALKISEENAFKEKVNNLCELISKRLDKPKIEKNQTQNGSNYNYSDKYIWKKNNLSVNLYFDVSGEFKRVRLIVYEN